MRKGGCDTSLDFIKKGPVLFTVSRDFDSSLILLSFCSFRFWVPWTRSGNDLNRAQVLTLPDSATWRIALGQISRERTNDSGEIAPALAPVRCTDRVRATSRPPSAGRLRGGRFGCKFPCPRCPYLTH